MVKKAPKSTPASRSKAGMPKTISKTPNADIIEGLEKLKRKNELEKNRMKALAYRKAIETLKTVKEPITQIS